MSTTRPVTEGWSRAKCVWVCVWGIPTLASALVLMLFVGLLSPTNARRNWHLIWHRMDFEL